jgi:hypothetical protein
VTNVGLSVVGESHAHRVHGVLETGLVRAQSGLVRPLQVLPRAIALVDDDLARVLQVVADLFSGGRQGVIRVGRGSVRESLVNVAQ